MGFPENLKELRTEQGLSYRNLANKSGVSRAAIIGYESGAYSPSDENYTKLLEALNTTEDKLGTPLRRTRGGARPGPRRRAHTSAFIPADTTPVPEITIPEGKVKPCFNQKCLLNKNCCCQSPIVVNEMAGCENQHKITEASSNKDKLLKTFRNVGRGNENYMDRGKY